jgi:soluble lytic murein transglycosylase
MLLSLGLGPEARRELGAAGIEAPRKGTPLPTTDAGRELGWITSALFEAAGDFAASHAYARYVDVDYARRWPLGDDELKWRLSFPRAYAALVEEDVKRTGQPAALELAIMREESAFDPNLESFANAVGLTQLTPPPAARFADGLPHDAQALRDPTINLAIGTRELGNLYGNFDKDVALAIAGYNAGEGAVRRWLRDPANKDRELDELVERIPYDETRGYTKRVLGSYFTYAWLERGASPLARMPRLRFDLPSPKRR